MINHLSNGLATRPSNETVDLLSSVLDSSTEYSIIGTDLDGGIVLWNEGARRIYGYEPGELVGRANWATLYTPEDVATDRCREILAATRRDGKWEGTIDRVRKNAQRFQARVVVTARRDELGSLIGYLVISKDISGEIRRTAEIKDALFYTRSLIELNIDGIISTDPSGVITDVNALMCDITGYSRDDLIGTPFRSYFTDPQRADDGISRVVAEDRVTDYELTMRAKDGRETIVSYNATTFRDAQGHLQGVFAAARNITAQKRLEDDLREIQNYTRGLIEASVDPMITVNQDLIITDVNGQMVRLTEVPKDELIGSRFVEYFTEPALAMAGVEQTLREATVTNYELTLGTASGREVLVSFNASIFRDTEGIVRGIFAVARDITHVRELEEQFKRVQTDQRRLEEQYRRVQE
ncbi:MAG TPA: PAS domain-containing protein, partial [Chloroflexota bacterium]|nr:PAS domain-containing protein [Chloroflexota bacterium]